MLKLLLKKLENKYRIQILLLLLCSFYFLLPIKRPRIPPSITTKVSSMMHASPHMTITTHPSSEEEWAPFKQSWDEQTKKMADMSLEETRKIFAEAPLALPENAPVPGEDIEITEEKAPVRDGSEIVLRIFRNLKVKGDGKSTLILKIHGGGWVQMNHNVDDPENRFLATIPNVVVVSTTYHLAPEFKFPHGLENVYDVLQWCKTNAAHLGVDPEKIIVGGNSAGANLAAALILLAQTPATRTTGIIAQMLEFPATCHPEHYPKDRYKLTSWDEQAEASVLNSKTMRKYWDHYMRLVKDAKNYLASPLLAQKEQLQKAPKTFLVVAGNDPLHDEGVAYAKALEDAGVDVQLDEWPGLPHAFMLVKELPSTARYFDRITEFVRSVIDDGHREEAPAAHEEKPENREEKPPGNLGEVQGEKGPGS